MLSIFLHPLFFTAFGRSVCIITTHRMSNRCLLEMVTITFHYGKPHFSHFLYLYWQKMCKLDTEHTHMRHFLRICFGRLSAHLLHQSWWLLYGRKHHQQAKKRTTNRVCLSNMHPSVSIRRQNLLGSCKWSCLMKHDRRNGMQLMMIVKNMRRKRTKNEE